MTENHPNSLTQNLLAKRLPMLSSLLVMISSGSIEKGNAKAKKTCELFIRVFKASCC
ncbi:unknown [Ligilactobacillus ruminis CAG:367]|nr:unknown [Ligilactobacillus ruminis CAG:367]